MILEIIHAGLRVVFQNLVVQRVVVFHINAVKKDIWETAAQIFDGIDVINGRQFADLVKMLDKRVHIRGNQ
ncbi:hypothetical protein [Sneathiella aquimaris]|uniref:hypothetical protein n=1 Tax=Sneathiella aquimaris TaxID=2599305 RepID=UPI00146A6403|nr:hypothetical protein [Sneathiella aquimaris]